MWKQFSKQNTITVLTAGNIEQCENEIGLLFAYLCAFHNRSDLNFSRGNFFSAACIYTLCQAIDSDSNLGNGFQSYFFLFEDFNNSLHTPRACIIFTARISQKELNVSKAISNSDINKKNIMIRICQIASLMSTIGKWHFMISFTHRRQ